MVAILFYFLISQSGWAQQSYQAETLFEINVHSPSLLTFCRGALWVYSHGRNELVQINENTKSEMFVSERYLLSAPKLKHLSSLTCRGEQILVSFESYNGDGFYGTLLPQYGQANVANLKVSPLKKRITDLQCRNQRCALVSEGKVFTSEDLKKWKDIEAPPSSTVSSVHSQKNINPFDDWQESLIIAKGRYTKVLITDKGLTLLDPFRSIVANYENGKWSKWGTWGVWEGQMLSPKAFAKLGTSTFLISDIGLKSLFLFNSSGDYLALLGTGSKLLSPEMALAIATSKDLIVVADFKNQKVFGLKIKSKDIFLRNTDFVRTNLFRRPDILKDSTANRCFKCHDGTINDSLDKIASNKSNHPVNFAFKQKTDLSLENGNVMTCSTCHNPHHGAVVKDLEIGERPQYHPPYLKKEWRDLCLSCHQDHTGGSNNHPDKAGKACVTCHMVHGGTDKLLRQPVPQLCWSCHSNKTGEHRKVDNFLDIERAKDLSFKEGQINCMTCHDQHGEKLGSKLRVDEQKILVFCASCHGQKTQPLYKNFHRLIRSRRSK